MTDIIIRRVGQSEYELEINGSVVQKYNQSKMGHPWDWIGDATANGATESEIRARGYEFIDERS